MLTLKIAVLGAMNNLGREVVQVLAEKGVPVKQVSVLMPGNAPGMTVGYGDEDEELHVKQAETFDFSNVDVVVSAAGDAVAQTLRKAAAAGSLVIDLSGAFLSEPDVKPVLPGLTEGDLALPVNGIVACPAPLTAMLARVLAPLHKIAGVNRVTVASYQAVATMGRVAMDELFTQTRAIFVNDEIVKEQFPKQIAFNVIPQTAPLREDGQSEEEFRLAVEIKKLLGAKIKVAATCAFVPTFLGTGMAVTVELAHELESVEATKLLRRAPGVTMVDQRIEEGMITPAETAGEDGVYVSRLRDDATVDNGLSLWISGDSLRRSAVDAVAIVEAWAAQKLAVQGIRKLH